MKMFKIEQICALSECAEYDKERILGLARGRSEVSAFDIRDSNVGPSQIAFALAKLAPDSDVISIAADMAIKMIHDSGINDIRIHGLVKASRLHAAGHITSEHMARIKEDTSEAVSNIYKSSESTRGQRLAAHAAQQCCELRACDALVGVFHAYELMALSPVNNSSFNMWARLNNELAHSVNRYWDNRP